MRLDLHGKHRFRPLPVSALRVIFFMYSRYFSDILGGAFFIYLLVYDIRHVYLAVLLKRLPAEYAAALHKAATILILLLYTCFLLCSNDVFRFRFYIIFNQPALSRLFCSNTLNRQTARHSFFGFDLKTSATRKPNTIAAVRPPDTLASPKVTA